jgi:DNA (cytosine-5)-methyltransferase 1
LSEIIVEDPNDVEWHSESDTERLLSLMSVHNLAKVDAAKREDRRIIGTIYRRTRRDEAGEKVETSKN